MIYCGSLLSSRREVQVIRMPRLWILRWEQAFNKKDELWKWIDYYLYVYYRYCFRHVIAGWMYNRKNKSVRTRFSLLAMVIGMCWMGCINHCPEWICMAGRWLGGWWMCWLNAIMFKICHLSIREGSIRKGLLFTIMNTLIFINCLKQSGKKDIML